MKCNQSRPGFELVSTITITPRAPPLACSSTWRLISTPNEAVHNISVFHQPWYYQPKQVPNMPSTFDLSLVGWLVGWFLWRRLFCILYWEISLPGGGSIPVLSEEYETSYLFYVTLSFLCNIICYLISVFVFSLVTLSGATTPLLCIRK